MFKILFSILNEGSQILFKENDKRINKNEKILFK